MSPTVQEWLNLVVRWAHVIAAIMWIGDSFLFMWLDSHLSKPTRPREGDVQGELWMTHSGGFYEVVKRKSLLPNELPDTLFWFKWESYSTWITGFLLIIIVYYLGGAAMLVDVSSTISHLQAVGISLGLILGGLGVYSLLCLTPLAKNYRLFAFIGLLLVMATSFGLSQIFTPRAVFLQLGAMLGTVMTSNVFFRIIPAQRHMLAMTKAGQPVDTSYGLRAKSHSTHNHYLTLPVLFTMLSNHFPGLYGHAQSWLVLGLLFVTGVGVKYFMNFRLKMPVPMLLGTVAAMIGVGVLTQPTNGGNTALMDKLKAEPKVSFATVETIITARCLTCHAKVPSSTMFNAPPGGVMFDSPQLIAAHAERIFIRSVQTKTMPLGNLTGLTEEERTYLGAWIAQGANIKAEGASAITAKAAEAKAFGSAAEEAKSVFGTVCVACHGSKGMGDGPSAVALNPKPRAFSDPVWQASVDDAHLTKVILEGGMAVGKSAIMPANEDLVEKPEVVKELVKIVRGFKKE